MAGLFFFSRKLTKLEFYLSLEQIIKKAATDAKRRNDSYPKILFIRLHDFIPKGKIEPIIISADFMMQMVIFC
jgi:hypothetical protein